MDVVALRWFQQVAEGMTVTEVADLAMVSQPGVSRALARLETEVGAKLFVKVGRVLRLTRAGAAFKTHVDTALQHYDDAVAAVAEMVDPETGLVVLGYQLSFGTWLVPELIAGFRRDFPQVRFQLLQTDDAEGFLALADGRHDLEITTLDPAVAVGGGEAVAWDPLFSQGLCVAVPAHHPLARRRACHLREVAADAFIALPRAWALRRQVDDLTAAAGFEPRWSFECDDLQVVRGFVAAGLGVAVVPPREGHERPTGAVRLVRLLDRGASRQVGLARNAERRLLPSAAIFRAHVLAESARGVSGRPPARP